MPDPVLEGFRLSPQQSHIWRLLHAAERGLDCRTRGVIAVDGPLTAEAVETAWQRLVGDYEILATTFQRLPGMALPLQVVSAGRVPAIRRADLEHRSPGELEVAVEALLDEARRVAPGLEQGPPVSLTLARLSSQRHLLLVEGPALCLDALAVELLARRLGEACEASFEHGSHSPEPIQYADVAEWSLERLASSDEDVESGRSHWRELAQAAAPIRLRWERQTPPTDFRPARVDAALSPELSKQVENAAHGGEVPPAVFLLACWHTLLARLTDQPSLVGGTLHNGRTDQELRGCLGPLSRMLPLRTELGDRRPFVEVLAEVRTGLEQADRWHDVYPLPGPCHSYCYEFQDRPTWSTGRLTFTLARAVAHGDDYRLKLVCARTDAGFATELYYDGSLLAAEDARRLVDSFGEVVRSAAQSPQAAVADLCIIAPAELQRVIRLAEPEHRPTGEADPVHRMFERQAKHDPGRPAVLCGDERLTYGELDQRATRLARRLREAGVAPETIVAICLKRSPAAAVGILAVLKAGGAWLPLDPSYPMDRLAFMLRDAKAGVVITERGLDLELPGREIRRFLIDEDDPRATDGRVASWPSAAEDLAYLIYTSGSTGQPKGVMCTHGSLSRYAQALREPLGLTADDVYLHTASFGFSSSVRQLLAPLAAGASIVLASPEEIRDPARLFETIRRLGVTIVDLVPSYLRTCLATLEGMPPSDRVRLLDNRLRLILTASEPLLADEAHRWSVGLGHPARLLNMFGQTETTGIVATHPVQVSRGTPGSIVPVGRPIANARLLILDRQGRPVPAGLVGEIYVGGAGVSRGYLHRRGLTAERFVPDPYGAATGARLYRTGDLGAMRADGVIEFIGRADHQIKVRGFRVEPGEVESVLRQHPGVDTAVVVARDHGSGDPQLVGYVVSSHGHAEPAELQRFVRGRVPEYMVPAIFVRIDALPLTPTGKVDRRALAQRELPPERSSNGRVAPATTTEKRLAEIWTEVLEVDEVGIRDDFFDLGGNSLLVAQVIARVRRNLRANLPLNVLFERSTIAELASEIDRLNTTAQELG